MADVPYKKWLDYLLLEKQRFHIDGMRVLDLACGTGELSILLAKNGFDVTGVDLSGDMLMVAQGKAEREGIELSLYEQNMSELEGLGIYDIAVIFCDSLNYLSTPEDVQKTFSNVHAHLKNGGLFIFDVHSPYKMEHIFMDETFAVAEEEVSYIWNCFPGEHSYSVEHELTFFVREEQSGKYERFEELHKQRTYLIEEYQSWLEDVGFSVEAITADFTDQFPVESSERIFFTCKKK
nr:class I SAM-dependent methyltransferase [Lederbergia citrea]